MSKFLIDETGGPLNFMAYQFSMGMILNALVIQYYVFSDYDFSVVFIPQNLVPLVIASVLAFLGFMALLIGFSVGNVSVGGVILSSRVFISIPLAYLLIGEIYPTLTYIFIFIALVGSVINSWREGMDFWSLITFKAKGMRWFIITALFWSLSNFMVRYLNEAIPSFVFIFFRQIILVVLGWTAYLVATRKFGTRKIITSRKLSINILAYALVVMCAQFGIITALGKSLTLAEGIGVLEGSATLILSILYAKFVNNDVLDEPLDRKSLIIRFFGAGLALLGTLGAIFS